MKKFKTLSKNRVFKNDIIEVYEEKLHLPNDNTVTWTFTSKRDAVAIVSMIDNSVIFVKQYRPAIEKEILEIPAGIVEKGEGIREAALREFEEETGYKANKIEKIFTYYGSPGLNSSQFHIFYATELTKTKQHLDENEFLEIVKIPINEIDITSFEDAKTIIGINYIKNLKS
ncbi:MAG: DNA mismatch repair protein MutT [Fusobacteriales bacterium]|nr:MAG: DNA mismatch repair protein MutT [Fusobacteriales bacterium]